MRDRVLPLIIIFSLGITAHGLTQVVLSEIMFNPTGNERYNEFVEIYNVSESDTIDLFGWLVSDGTKMNKIVAHGQGTLLAPKHYALIFVPKYFSDSKQYDDVIPTDVLVLTIENSQFGAYGFSNDRSESVAILAADSTTITSWGYKVKNQDGISEEKKVLGRGDFDGNWGNSFVVGGTPGFLNSITPLQFDLALSAQDIFISPQNPSAKDSVTISFLVKNIGSASSANFGIGLFINDSLVFQKQVKPDHFSWLDSLQDEIKLPPFSVGSHQVLLRIDFSADQDFSNNEAMIAFSVQPAMGDVVISEIYNRPVGAQGQWMELQNESGELLDLTNWKVKSTFSQMILPQLILNPGGMIVLSQFPDVRKNFWRTKTMVVDFGDDFIQIDAIADTLVLSNENGATIDSTFYRIETETKEKSLERSMPVGYPPRAGDWEHCPHPLGATPGEKNAIDRNFVDVALDGDSTKIKFEKPATGKDIVFTVPIYNFGNLMAHDVRVSLLEIKGESFPDTIAIDNAMLAGTILPLDSLPAQLVFRNPFAGSHKLLFECSCNTDEYNADNFLSFTVDVGYPPSSVVINEIMYKTETKSEEWIELYNPQDFEVDLKGWSLADSRKTVQLTTDSFIVAPGTYAVISHKSSNYLCANLISANLPELNNTGDAVILYDNAGSVIDSVVFAQSWGGEKFVSLERIRFEDSSLDSLNWTSCIDSIGNTAGRLNSVSPREFDAALSTGTLRFSPQHPRQGEAVSLSVELVNFGREALENITVQFYLQTLGQQSLVPIGQSIRIASMRPKDNRVVEQIWQNSLAGVHRIVATVKQTKDQVAQNDTVRTMITVSYPQGAAIVNEIMYNPAEGMSEWVELFNPSTFSIQFMLWTISDTDTANAVQIADSSLFLDPEQFLVISRDSSLSSKSGLWLNNKKFPALGNSGDEIYLRDGNGRVIDKLAYEENWGGAKGRSLERMSPIVATNDKRNWSTCVDPAGNTAGRKNSLFTKISPSKLTLKISPDPFSPDGDGFQDVAGISYSLHSLVATINIRIFDMRGRLVRFLCNNEPSGSQRTVFWNGLDDEGLKCRIGIYIVFLQALDARRGVIEQKKMTVVLAAPL